MHPAAVLASDRQLLVWRQVTNAEKADKECDLQMAQLCSELHENEDAEANAVPFTHIQNSCCLFNTLLATLSFSSGFPALPNVASSSTLVLDFVCYDSFMQSTNCWFIWQAARIHVLAHAAAEADQKATEIQLELVMRQTHHEYEVTMHSHGCNSSPIACFSIL